MGTSESFDRDLYSVNEGNFADIALQLFHFQARNNPVYRSYINHLRLDISMIKTLNDIPFLPISFFKNHLLKTGTWEHETIFKSSGTTGPQTSSHAVKNLSIYRDHALRCFEYFFGDIRQFHFLALLPSYLERRDSSLVAMMEYFIDKSCSRLSSFYLHDTAKLLDDIRQLGQDGKKTILWGVTFALLDLAERYKPDLSHCLIFETGGMKGRRREITRNELHARLTRAFGVKKIFSEYGMTELFSQAYSDGQDAFFTPPWMKLIARDLTDPMAKGLLNETGGINVIDLANIDSIAFIETEDIGKIRNNGAFEVLGRMDNSDVRGCNLMVE